MQEKKEKQRTITQNNSLHLYLRELAEALNISGLEMHIAFKDIEVPWNEHILKSFWKKIESVHVNKTSTTEMSTKEVTEIYEIINRHFAQWGVHIPWPSVEEQAIKQLLQ